MRPILLQIEGINSFVSMQELDFERAGADNLFCITGATGSGKTTIFDSILLSLYGKGERGNIGGYINLKLNKAQVRFIFEMNSKRYEVIRRFKRNGANEAELIVNGTPECVGVSEVNKTLADVIGLDASEFTSVILLRQGEFGKFLSDTSQNQTKTVGSIFRLDRFIRLSKNVRAEKAVCRQRLEDIRDFLQASNAGTEQDRKEIKSQISTAKQAAAELEKTIEALKKELKVQRWKAEEYRMYENASNQYGVLKVKIMGLNAQLEQAADKMSRYAADEQSINNQKAKLASLNNTLAVLEHLKESERDKSDSEAKQKSLMKEREKVISEIDIAHKEFQKNSEDVLQTEKQISEILSRLKTVFADAPSPETIWNVLADIRRLRSEKDALEQKTAETAQGLERVNVDKARELQQWQKASLKLNELKKQALSAEQSHREQTRLLEEAKLINAAQTVALSLKEGDVCPVCGGIFCCSRTLDCGSIQALSECAAAADAEREKVRQRLEKAAQYMENQGALLQTLDKESIRLENEKDGLLAQHSQRQKEWALIEREQDFNALIERYEALRGAKEAALHSLGQKENAELKLKSVDWHIEENNATLARAKEKLGELCGKDIESEKSIIKQKISELESMVASHETSAAAARQERDAVTVQIAVHSEALKDLEERLAVKPDFDPAAYERLEQSEADLEKRRIEYEKQLATALARQEEMERSQKLEKKYLSEAKEKQKRLDLLTRLEEVTKDSKLLNYAALEYIREFTDTASALLNSMTQGQYTLEYITSEGERDSGAFYVRDYLRGGLLRRADSLSGGETFLASLSIAIAISKTVAHRREYGVFFLDEGFGTLDNDLIDTVHGALQTLSQDCLVGVITHSTELSALINSTVNVIHSTEEQGSLIKYGG